MLQFFCTLQFTASQVLQYRGVECKTNSTMASSRAVAAILDCHGTAVPGG